MSRRADTILLLSSLDPDGTSWYDHSIETTTGNIVRRFGVAGEGPTHRIACPSCGGDKRRRVRGFLVKCPPEPNGCDGKGWVAVDDYTERRIGDSSTHLETGTRYVSCDACGGERRHRNGEPCLKCRGSGSVPVTESQWRSARHLAAAADASEYGAAGDPVSAAIDKRDELGSYWELGLALGALRLELRTAYRVVASIYIDRRLELNGHAPTRLAHDIGVAYVVRLMPDPIKVPPAVRAVDKRRRYNERVLKRRSREEAA